MGESGLRGPVILRHGEKCLDASVSSGTLATPQKWGGLPTPSIGERPLLSFDPEVRGEAEFVEKAIYKMLDGAEEFPVNVTSGSADISTGYLTLANSHNVRYSAKKSMVSVSLETISDQSTGYEFDQSVTMSVDPKCGQERQRFLHIMADQARISRPATIPLSFHPWHWPSCLETCLFRQ